MSRSSSLSLFGLGLKGEGRERKKKDAFDLELELTPFFLYFRVQKGTYVLRFDAVNAEISDAHAQGPIVDPKTGVEVVVPPAREGEGLTLDERAVALATAISSEYNPSSIPTSSREVE